MDLKLKQRAVMKLLTKEGCAPMEIQEWLKTVFGDTVVDISNVRHWVKKFKEGETDISGKPRCGRPSTAVTDDNLKHADELIRADRRI